MKFDPFNWQEVTVNDTYESPKGRLHIMCSKDAAVFVQAQGYEVLAGVGTKIDITTAQAVNYRVEAPKGTRVFVETKEAHHVVSAGEIFTNFDKKPTVSAAVDEINRAMRVFKLEQQEFRRQMHAENLKIARERKRAREPELLQQEQGTVEADETDPTAAE